MIDITDKSSCSGCSACMAVCNHDAIKMERDALGFLYPRVDVDKCVGCNLCEKVCSFSKPPRRIVDYPQAYLARHKDVAEVLKSKSGAAFVALSDVILKEGGTIYGAELNDEFLVEHARATNYQERDRFRGSKYIQSNLCGIFAKIKSDLRANKKVLFSGTPCQVAGVKAYIGPKLSENLFLVDILCHGVASSAVWRDYLKQIESRKKKKIQRCIPRNPKYGWYNNVDTFIFADGSEYNSDYFTGYVYHKWITQRWSCNVCPFTCLDRVSDVTIGDAWGADRIAPDFDKDNIGSSVVLINTEKGRKLFDSASTEMLKMPVDIGQMMQPVMKHPTVLHPKRQAFEKDYASHGFKYVRMIYLNNTMVAIKAHIRRTLSKIKRTLIG